MTDPTISIARKAYQAYIDIGDDFHFTSPLDNRLNRQAYFDRCWKNSETITDFTFINLVGDGERVFVTYEGQSATGKRFRNTEIMTVRKDKIVEVEVYFGWPVPHADPVGGFVDA